MLMAKRGKSQHAKRLAALIKVPGLSKKGKKWILSPRPGPHPKNASLSLGVLLRDVLKVGKDLKEAKKAVAAGLVIIDGKIVRDVRRPIGLMDIVEIPKLGKTWRIQIDSAGRLMPKEIDAKTARIKLAKVIGKHTIKGNKIQITLHNGRTMLADNQIKVGSTLKLSMPGFKLEGQIPLAPGSRCLVVSGKHAGEIAVLEKIMERAGSMGAEAELKSGGQSFVTVAKYLFAVDDEFA
jgi:small subunit ribosomal protein S4e